MRAEVHVFDKSFAWRGQVGEYSDLRATRAHLAVSDAEFAFPSDLDVRSDLATPGGFVVVMLDGEQFVKGRPTLSGGFTDYGDVSCEVEGIEALWGRILGWPVPGAALSAQTVAYWRTSPQKVPAETAVKSLITANVARLGLPVTVAADQGRGGDVELSYRFHPFTDRWQDGLAQSGIGLSVELVEGVGWLVDVTTPTTHPIPLTAEDGVITGGTWGTVLPTATHGVGASTGEATDRTFVGPIIDTARLAEYGFCGELVVDARDTDSVTVIEDRIRTALAEAGPKVSLSLELTESADFAYGVYRVGDVVSVRVPGGAVGTDRLIEATLTHSTSVPEPEVTFQVGARTDDPDVALWQSVSTVAAGVHDLTVR